MKRITLILVFIIFPILVSAQDASWRKKVNLLNENGKKEGLWITTSYPYKYYYYYKNGIQDGFFYVINLKQVTLACTGEMRDGHLFGTLYTFSETGHLYGKSTNFQKNDIPSPIEPFNFEQSRWPYCCHTVLLHPNLQKKAEGTLLFGEGTFLDRGNCVRYGEWKFYDEDGKLTGTIMYRDTNTSFHPSKEGRYEINQLNENGEKEGLWVTTENHWKDYYYYKNGVQDGPFYLFYRAGLAWVGEMHDGKLSGSLYSFFDEGHLESINTNIQKGFIPTPKTHLYLGDPIWLYQSYCIQFHPNGKKSAEGIMLFDDVTDCVEYGIWKYYNDEEELKKIKIYGDTTTVLHPGDEGWPE